MIGLQKIIHGLNKQEFKWESFIRLSTHSYFAFLPFLRVLKKQEGKGCGNDF